MKFEINVSMFITKTVVVELEDLGNNQTDVKLAVDTPKVTINGYYNTDVREMFKGGDADLATEKLTMLAASHVLDAAIRKVEADIKGVAKDVPLLPAGGATA